MELKIDLNRKDFLEFNKYVLFRSRLKRTFIISTIFILLSILILNFNKPLDLILIGIELIIFCIAWSILLFILYQLNFQRIKKLPDTNGSILGQKTYILQDDGLKEITETSETLTKWNGIKKIIETEEYIYVFVDKIAAYVIPKRYFSEEKERIEFIETIKSKTEK